MRIYLLEINVYDPVVMGEVTLRFSSAAGIGYTSAATDTPPLAFYEPRVIQAGSYRRDIFDKGTSGGASRIGWGYIELTNVDGALDAFADYGLSGRTFGVLVGDSADPLTAFTVVAFGTMLKPEISTKLVSIRIRDKQLMCNVPVQATTYAGDNILPDGLEGGTDLANKPKPLAFGPCRNITPVCVNTSRLIYQVSDICEPATAIGGVPAVYDMGLPLSAGSLYTSQADMETSAPAAGTYRVWPEGGMFRLGSPPSGEVTADVDGLVAEYVSLDTVPLVMEHLLYRSTSIAIDEVNTDELPRGDYPQQVGLYISGERKLNDVFDELCRSVSLWWGFDRFGMFRLQPFVEPDADIPYYTVDSSSIKEISLLSTSDTESGVPAWQAVVEYDRNWTVQTSGLAAGVAADRRTLLSVTSRSISATDADVKIPYPAAEILQLDALLANQADAQIQADLMLIRNKGRRDRVSLTIPMSAKLSGTGVSDEVAAAAIDLGEQLLVVYDRFGYGGGKLFRVIGAELDCDGNEMTAVLWG